MSIITCEENIVKAKYDFERFLQLLYKFIQPKSNWQWLGFTEKDTHRMKDKYIFAKEFLKDVVSLTYKFSLNSLQPTVIDYLFSLLKFVNWVAN